MEAPLLDTLRRSGAARMVKRLLRGADDVGRAVHRRLVPGSVSRVLFDVRNAMGFDAQAPVIAALLQRPRVRAEASSAVLDGAELAAWLSARGLSEVPVVAPATVRNRAYDVIIITDTWMVRSWRTACVAYLHHGSSFGNRDIPYALRFLLHGTAQYLFCLSEAEITHLLEHYGAWCRTRTVVTGQPKLDALVNQRHDRRGILESCGLDPGRATVILCSHWTPASLFRSCDLGPLRSRLAELPVNLLVTAHPSLFNSATERYSGGVDWAARLSALFDGPRMRVFPREPEPQRLLAAADVLVGDHSSVCLEYATLFRPMVVYRNPSYRYDDQVLEGMLRETAAVVDGVEAIPAALARALAVEPVSREARQRFLDHCFGYLGKSAVRTADVIESLARTARLPG